VDVIYQYRDHEGTKTRSHTKISSYKGFFARLRVFVVTAGLCAV
jgi:hypothetical protein